MSKKEYQATKNTNAPASANEPQESLEARIIAALGGADNIVTVTCCATRLRVTVKDEALVVSDDVWKEQAGSAWHCPCQELPANHLWRTRPKRHNRCQGHSWN